jgi:cell division protein FtsZ
LRSYVNSLIVIPNDKLMQVLGNQVTLDEGISRRKRRVARRGRGSCRIISCPGMISVDFADVRDGGNVGNRSCDDGLGQGGRVRSARAHGGRTGGRMSAIGDIDIADARGVLVNISASKSLFQLQEMYDVMDVIKAFASESATVIAGTVYDDCLEDELRVTIVATGLGKTTTRLQPKPLTMVMQATGTDGAPTGNVNYEELEQPAVMRRNRNQTVEAMRQSGVEMLDIPAFLRKQAD